MDFNGKRIVITGATSGLGLEVLKLLLHFDRVKILAVGRSTSQLPVDEKVYAFQCDVASREGVDSVFAEAEVQMGGIDLFWANAGFGCYEVFGKPDWKQMETLFQTNVFSPFYALEKLLTLYPNQPVHFAVTDSIAGQLEVPGFALYVATKHAVNGGMKAVQYEVSKLVKLSIIYPVATKTRFFERAGTTLDKSGPVQSSEACARAILKGLQKDKKKIYPYSFWVFIQGLLTFLPFVKHLTMIVLNRQLQSKSKGKEDVRKVV